MTTTPDVLDAELPRDALITIPAPQAPAQVLSLQRAPDIVLQEAATAARALTEVISKKPDKVMMNGEQYLEFEDWQTLGRFYGISARVSLTRLVQIGDVMGYEATAEAVRADGFVLSRADGMCLNDEPKWSTRTKYEWHYVLKAGGTSAANPGNDLIEWEPNPRAKTPGGRRPKKDRVQVGEEKVPLFQLRSMAQTRACAKALRNVLAWVVVLAGYQATPAEELDGLAERKKQDEPQASTKPESTLTKGQQKQLFEAAHAVGWSDSELARYLKEKHGVDKTAQIPVSKLAGILADLNTGAI